MSRATDRATEVLVFPFGDDNALCFVPLTAQLRDNLRDTASLATALPTLPDEHRVSLALHPPAGQAFDVYRLPVRFPFGPTLAPPLRDTIGERLAAYVQRYTEGVETAWNTGEDAPEIAPARLALATDFATAMRTVRATLDENASYTLCLDPEELTLECAWSTADACKVTTSAAGPLRALCGLGAVSRTQTQAATPVPASDRTR